MQSETPEGTGVINYDILCQAPHLIRIWSFYLCHFIENSRLGSASGGTRMGRRVDVWYRHVRYI